MFWTLWKVKFILKIVNDNLRSFSSTIWIGIQDHNHTHMTGILLQNNRQLSSLQETQIEIDISDPHGHKHTMTPTWTYIWLFNDVSMTFCIIVAFALMFLIEHYWKAELYCTEYYGKKWIIWQKAVLYWAIWQKQSYIEQYGKKDYKYF